MRVYNILKSIYIVHPFGIMSYKTLQNDKQTSRILASRTKVCSELMICVSLNMASKFKLWRNLSQTFHAITTLIRVNWGLGIKTEGLWMMQY